MKEQRRTNRFPVQRTVLYRGQGHSSLGTVCEVSLTGLKMRCTSVLEPGSLVTLVMLGPVGTYAREVTCLVHWQAARSQGDREAGLSFQCSITELCESWVGELLGDLEAQHGPLFQRRETVRVPVRLPARASQAERVPSTTLGFAEIIELSEGGAVVRTRRSWSAGEQVRLHLNLRGRVLELSASVLKVRSRGMGCLAGSDYSLQFTGVEPQDAEILRRMVVSAVRRHKAA